MDRIFNTEQNINSYTFPGQILLHMTDEAQLETKLSKQREKLELVEVT